MRSIDSATYNALLDAPNSGLTARNLVTIYARDLDGVGGQMFAFWNDLDTVSAFVVGGQTGSPEMRDFVGDGSILDIDRIPLTSDLTVRTVRVTLSQIHTTVQNMARGYDLRSAYAEIHRALFNPQTGEVIAEALPHFVGKINKAPINTPAAGDEGSLPLDIVSATRELTRTSPAKKSDETQRRRTGDRGRRYTGTANRKIWWGQSKDRAAA